MALTATDAECEAAEAAAADEAPWVDMDELRLMLIPAAEATVVDCEENVTAVEAELEGKKVMLVAAMAEREAAEAQRVRTARDRGREALRRDAVQEAAQLGDEICSLNSSLTDFDIAQRELRYAEGAMDYVMQASGELSMYQSLIYQSRGMNINLNISIIAAALVDPQQPMGTDDSGSVASFIEIDEILH